MQDNTPSQQQGPYDAAQERLQQANFAAQQAANRAAEAANQRAARSNAGGSQGNATTKAVYRKGR